MLLRIRDDNREGQESDGITSQVGPEYAAPSSAIENSAAVTLQRMADGKASDCVEGNSDNECAASVNADHNEQ